MNFWPLHDKRRTIGAAFAALVFLSILVRWSCSRPQYGPASVGINIAPQETRAADTSSMEDPEDEQGNNERLTDSADPDSGNEAEPTTDIKSAQRNARNAPKRPRQPNDKADEPKPAQPDPAVTRKRGAPFRESRGG